MMTGEQYKNSLRDGRRIYQDGKLVADMDTDPLLAPALTPWPPDTTSTTGRTPTR